MREMTSRAQAIAELIDRTAGQTGRFESAVQVLAAALTGLTIHGEQDQTAMDAAAAVEVIMYEGNRETMAARLAHVLGLGADQPKPEQTADEKAAERDFFGE